MDVEAKSIMAGSYHGHVSTADGVICLAVYGVVLLTQALRFRNSGVLVTTHLRVSPGKHQNTRHPFGVPDRRRDDNSDIWAAPPLSQSVHGYISLQSTIWNVEHQ